MPFDFGNFEFKKKPENNQLERRIYVGEDGNIRVEERHFRKIFSPEEYVALLFQILRQKHKNYEQKEML